MSDNDNDEQQPTQQEVRPPPPPPLILERPTFLQRIFRYVPKIDMNSSTFFRFATVSNSWRETLYDLGTFDLVYKRFRMSYSSRFQSASIFDRCLDTEQSFFATTELRSFCSKFEASISTKISRVKGANARLVVPVSNNSNNESAVSSSSPDEKEKNEVQNSKFSSSSIIDIQLSHTTVAAYDLSYENKAEEDKTTLIQEENNPNFSCGNTTVNVCAFSEDDKRLAVGCDNASVRIFDTNSGKLVRNVAGTALSQLTAGSPVATACFHQCVSFRRVLYYTVVDNLVMTEVYDEEDDDAADDDQLQRIFPLTNKEKKKPSSKRTTEVSAVKLPDSAKCYQLKMVSHHQSHRDAQQKKYFLVSSNFHGCINIFDASPSDENDSNNNHGNVKTPRYLRTLKGADPSSQSSMQPWDFCFAQFEFPPSFAAASIDDSRNDDSSSPSSSVKKVACFGYSSRRMSLNCWDLNSGDFLLKTPIQVDVEDTAIFYSAKIDISDDQRLLLVLRDNFYFAMYQIHVKEDAGEIHLHPAMSFRPIPSPVTSKIKCMCFIPSRQMRVIKRYGLQTTRQQKEDQRSSTNQYFIFCVLDNGVCLVVDALSGATVQTCRRETTASHICKISTDGSMLVRSCYQGGTAKISPLARGKLVSGGKVALPHRGFLMRKKQGEDRVVEVFDVTGNVTEMTI